MRNIWKLHLRLQPQGDRYSDTSIVIAVDALVAVSAVATVVPSLELLSSPYRKGNVLHVKLSSLRSSAMDLSHSTSHLSLGLSSHISAPPPRKISDDSISFQIDSSSRDSTNPVPALPLQLLEQQSDSCRDESGATERCEDEEEERDVEEFRILGHSLCLKRRRDGESSSSLKKPLLSCEQGLESRRNAVKAWGNQPLCVADPDIYKIMEKEKQRQYGGIELIASENFVCAAVMEALGSHLTNKYSEGMPGARYYVGNQNIDEIETLCCERALAAFDLDPESWGVNVQPYSCTSANFAVYTGLLLPGDRIMGLDTPSGGNTSHGYYTPNGRKVSGASIFFESLPYKVNPQTGYIDFEKLEERALDFRPKILICGGSSYPREWDYEKFRNIADRCGAVLMCDMAQISGLVAAKVRILFMFVVITLVIFIVLLVSFALAELFWFFDNLKR